VSEGVSNCSILDFEPRTKYDVALIKGVLIHLNPERLQEVHHKLYEASGKYILVCEYYNPSPVLLVIEDIKIDYLKETLLGSYSINMMI